MNVIARHDVIKYRKTEALLGFEDPAQIKLPIACEFKEKLFLMTTVGDVPDVTGKKMAIGARHRLFL
jgi:hypothetical protein